MREEKVSLVRDQFIDRNLLHTKYDAGIRNILLYMRASIWEFLVGEAASRARLHDHSDVGFGQNGALPGRDRAATLPFIFALTENGYCT